MKFSYVNLHLAILIWNAYLHAHMYLYVDLLEFGLPAFILGILYAV